VTRAAREINRIFAQLGYSVVSGPEVEYDRYNFTLVNEPPGHPARDAQDTLLEELTRAGVGSADARAAFGSRPPAVIHSFSGPVDYARDVLALGLAISFSGLVFKAGEEASGDVAAIVPADRLLVETDSPYLAPPGAPRKRNEPEWVRVTSAWVAARRGVTIDELGDGLITSYEALFGCALTRGHGPSRAT